MGFEGLFNKQVIPVARPDQTGRIRWQKIDSPLHYSSKTLQSVVNRVNDVLKNWKKKGVVLDTEIIAQAIAESVEAIMPYDFENEKRVWSGEQTHIPADRAKNITQIIRMGFGGVCAHRMILHHAALKQFGLPAFLVTHSLPKRKMGHGLVYVKSQRPFFTNPGKIGGRGVIIYPEDYAVFVQEQPTNWRFFDTKSQMWMNWG